MDRRALNAAPHTKARVERGDRPIDRSRHGSRLTAVRTLGVALGLVALVLGGVAVRAFALVAAGVQTVPFWPAARLYPPWAVLLALLGGIGLACAYGAVRLALLSRALLVAPAPYLRALDARRSEETP